MDFYLDIAKTVPADKLNGFIKRNGYQPLDPNKASALQVANALKWLVEKGGLPAYEELKALKESETKVLDEPKTDEPKTEEPQNSNCKSKGCTDCPCSKGKSKDGSSETSSKSESASSVSRSFADSPFAKFIHDNSTVLIISASVLTFYYLYKKYNKA